MMRLIMLIFALVAVGSPPTRAMAADFSLTVNASILTETEEPALQFRIKNSSIHSITMNRADLPWGNRYSLLIVAVVKGRDQPLPATHPIDDPRPDVVTIAPGEETVGEVRLRRYVENLDEALALGQIVVFWSYQAQTKEGEFLGDFGGWLQFPPSKNGTKLMR